jgi:hypothetical protein
VHVYAGGGNSWVAIVPFIVVVVVRLVSTQRRRQGGGPGVPGGAHGFTPRPRPTSAPRPLAGPAADTPSTVQPGFTGTAPGWFVDPFVRHEQRYWSGTAWTEHVLDGGTPALDPPPTRPNAT